MCTDSLKKHGILGNVYVYAIYLSKGKATCMMYLLGYPTSVVEGVGDEFISMRESLIS